MRQARHIFTLLLAAALLWSCRGIVNIEPDNIPEYGKGIGQMVMFSGGATSNVETKVPGGRTYYMPDSYRFVCRMYYKAQTGSEDFDISGNTDQTSWLKVSGSVGNSLYWNKEYNPVNAGVKGKGGVDDYGNDYSAPAFYWQNRKEHAFLAWTDLNRATSITGGTAKGALKFGEDLKYKVYTGEKVPKWTDLGYKIYGIDQYFASIDDMRIFVEETYTDEESIRAFNQQQNEIGSQYDWSQALYYYHNGWSCKFTSSNCTSVYYEENTKESIGWYQSQMFFDKVPFEGDPGALGLFPVYDSKTEQLIFYKNAEGEYVVEVVTIKHDEAPDTYEYYATDKSGNVLYDESTPRFKYYFSLYRVKQLVDDYNEFPALAFDLTRGSRTSMGQQPDIAQALEIQAPVGATQESNRVNLYFKHMFSQVQVNIRKPGDDSVDLDAGDIQKVELLGVTEEGYIFTDIDEEGKVRSAAYKEIDFSKYTEEQLKNNTYGTSLQMFELADAETGYVKSFNAITFGQLQAIRITWREKNTLYDHAATFRIPDTEHMNLRSGTKYVWNIEIRRGTLAIIRTEIIDWEYPEDEAHNGHTSGTIIN